MICMGLSCDGWDPGGENVLGVPLEASAGGHQSCDALAQNWPIRQLSQPWMRDAVLSVVSDLSGQEGHSIAFKLKMNRIQVLGRRSCPTCLSTRRLVLTTVSTGLEEVT